MAKVRQLLGAGVGGIHGIIGAERCSPWKSGL